ADHRSIGSPVPGPPIAKPEGREHVQRLRRRAGVANIHADADVVRSCLGVCSPVWTVPGQPSVACAAWLAVPVTSPAVPAVKINATTLGRRRIMVAPSLRDRRTACT